MRMRICRRSFLGCVSLLALAGPVLPATAASAGSMRAVALRAEAVDRPIGVETAAPRLSWRIEASGRGKRQSAYRIQVSSTAEALGAGRADLWDSGRVDSDDSIGVRYAGSPLASRQRCYWRVLTWDERGLPGLISEIGWWEMGLLENSDWSATWLAAEDAILRDDRAAGFAWLHGPGAGDAAHFRLVVELPAAGEATLFLAGTGAVKLWVNGAVVPVPTVRTSWGRLPTIDVPVRLPAGRQVIAVSVDPPAAEQPPAPKAAELAVFLRVALADGRVLRPGGHGWKASPTPGADWTASGCDDGAWRPAGVVAEPRPQPWPSQPGIYLRRAFAAPRPVRRARLYVTALGGYRAELNGRKIGPDLLTPENSDFRKTLRYRIHDVTDLLVPGGNALGIHVGDGWYASYALGVGRYAWGPAPRRLLAQLEIDYADGSREVVATGPGWQAARSTVVTSEIYDGEAVDARLDQPGWSTPGFDAARWEAAGPADAPPAMLVAQISPPITRDTPLAPKTISEPAPGVFVVDFGQNFAGWCRLRVKGRSGTRIEMRFAEILKPNGEVDQANLRAALATDSYILKGDPAGESFEPNFTYHGFRYVQLTGLSAAPDRADVEGVVVHSALAPAADLTIGNPLIQSLWRNTVWSQRSNFMGLPTDCPQRDERLGWMGDANVFWDAAAFNMDVESFTRTWMHDVRDAQAENGAFSDFSPAAFKFPPPPGKQIGASPGWADAGVCLPWTVWQRYGDTAIIDENWSAMTRYVQFIQASNPDFIWSNDRGSDFGDWLALDAKQPGDPTTPKDLVATAMWAHSIDCMAQMAEATGRKTEAARYRETWRGIVAAFQKRFVAADGAIGNESQTGYILALRYGLVPEVLRAAAAQRLVANIRNRGTLLTTGFLGTPNSLDVLTDAGFTELVYSLLLRTEFPSWGYMVAKGATTIWERWNGDTGDVAMNSFNHYALGAVSGFVFRQIAGIAPLAPGFRRIAVRPVLDPRVPAGGAVYRSVMGRIETRWRQGSRGRLTLMLSLPANTDAVVTLPAATGQTIRESGRPAEESVGVRAIARTDNDATYAVGSGDYRFEIS